MIYAEAEAMTSGKPIYHRRRQCPLARLHAASDMRRRPTEIRLSIANRTSVHSVINFVNAY